MSQNAASSASTSGNGKGKARAGAALDEEVDEKVLRRRLQYKLHQRRHRAKQKQKITTLELEVQNLAAEEQYLRAVMTSETTGPDYVGVDTVVTQWRRFCQFFAYTRYDPLSINVTTVGDLTVVVVDSIFSIRARRDGVVTLYPSLNGDLELTQKLSGSIINIQGKYRFTFDSNGIVTWFSAEWDLVNALQQALGDLADVSTVLSGANISSSTGQIQVDDAHVQETKPESTLGTT
ncbi:hypothetical protein AM588_10009655 [Phytophthora nicotianae]|uniref:BZIP domain-containing protein n=1 Tax=Phytophthora nicotianae TaxID=4792 RepID=A0A0W8DGU1_PHYNI|nr:hypothetical protein AM588_10009655 [Phytophthora nicotianae]